MQPILVPTTDVNSETAVIVEWRFPDGAMVRRGDVVAEVETSKSVIEVEAPGDGVVVHGAPAGAEITLGEPIGQVAQDQAELDRWQRARTERAPRPDADDVRATRSARALAERHGIDLVTLDQGSLITTKDVEVALAGAAVSERRRAAADAASDIAPLLAPDATRRLVLLGAGLGATQVLDIVSHMPENVVVAIVDDDEVHWGREVDGVPVVGGTDRLDQLAGDDLVDAAVITISTSVAARASLRELCVKLDLPLTNVIDPSARICRGVQLGTGNVICVFTHLGVGAVVGDNNFLSAYNSFDHHSQLGNDSSTGPGCVASGLVEVGDRVRMGTGVFVEPKVRVGHDAIVASGSVIVTDIPDGHVLKARAGSTVMSARRM